ncbi:MAG: RluA family pseudouridine synthase [Opitutales bacterium]
MSAESASPADLPLSEGVRILEDHPSGLVALFKPPGVLSQPNPPEEPLPEAVRKAREAQPVDLDPIAPQRPSLLQAEYDFDEECFFWDEGGEERRLYLLNRLDSPTTGVVLLSRRESLVMAVRDIFASHRVQKTYYAIVKGRPPNMPPLWIDVLERKRTGEGHLRVQSSSQAQSVARTRHQFVRQDRNRLGISLVRLSPVTGRTHQLRVQCAKRKVPIVGDQTYGDFKFNRRVSKGIYSKRMFLHAAALELRLQHEGEVIDFKAECPLPEDFSLLLDSHPELWVKDGAPGAPNTARSSSSRSASHGTSAAASRQRSRRRP